MGWTGAATITHALMRVLVFKVVGVSAATEITKEGAFPQGLDYSMLVLDSFDYIRVRALQAIAKIRHTESEAHRRFISTCKRFNLPLNIGKGIVGEFKAILVGGEFDGKNTTLGIQGVRMRNFVKLSLGMAFADRWEPGLIRHWLGVGSYMAGYRRPLYSLLQECYRLALLDSVVTNIELSCLDELLVYACLAPMAISNLGAPLCRHIYCTDASPFGGGVAVAR